MKILEENQHLF